MKKRCFCYRFKDVAIDINFIMFMLLRRRLLCCCDLLKDQDNDKLEMQGFRMSPTVRRRVICKFANIC